QLLAQKPDLKVIYTTGYSVDLVGRDFTLDESCNFLQKPYHPAKLLEVVRKALDCKKAVSF
ncbi:MAG TPA: hypothetical protein VK633_00170, partial [Verrucomicrobiae bacterium]|nr:hypothetical protein [Verrucomicrobiae bacterium]